MVEFHMLVSSPKLLVSECGSASAYGMKKPMPAKTSLFSFGFFQLISCWYIYEYIQLHCEWKHKNINWRVWMT